MHTMIEFLDTVGAAATPILLLPLVAWTLLWLFTEVALSLLPKVHPLVRYRATQAVLLALPAGLLLGMAIDVPALLPASAAVALLPEMGVTPGIAEAGPAGQGVVIDAAPPVAPVPASTIFGGALALVAAAAVVLLVRLFVQSLAVARLRRRLRPVTVLDLDEEVRAAAARFGMVRRVEVMAAEGVEVPMTFGLRRPLIVLPTWLEPAQRRMALLHEMAHVRHFDAAAQWLEAGLAAVFAFHPGVHRLRRQCALLRELSCDATLLGEAAVSRRQYAALLFTFVSPPARMMPVTVGMADRQSHITRRLEAMKAFPSASVISHRLAIGIALAVFCSGSLLLSASHVLAQAEETERASLRILHAVEAPDPPLVFVDGERVDRRVLAEIDPDDILTIDVLKGEKAVARFGEDAAAGAISIITKGQQSGSRIQVVSRRYAMTPVDGSRNNGVKVRADGIVLLDGEPLKGAQVFLRGLPGSHDGPSTTGPTGAFSIVAAPVQPPGSFQIEVRHPEHGSVTAPFVPRPTPPPPPAAPPGQAGDTAIFVVVEQMPVPEGGIEAIQRRVRYPELARRAGIEGTVFVRFVVNEDGSVSDAVCTRDVGAGTCEAAIDGIQRTRFTPGYQAGEPVRVRFSLPVRFYLATAELDVAADEGEAVVAAPLDAATAHEAAQRGGAVDEFAMQGAFPNPTSNELTFTFDLPDPAAVRLQLFDVTGRRVLEVPTRSFEAGGGHRMLVDIGGLASGVYVYRLEAGSEAATGRVSIVR